MHHYPFHVGDYIRATAHLDLIEDCVYRRLIDLYMETESPIPNETQQVIRRLRLGSSGLILESILSEFFTLEADNCWHNSRCDAEIMAYRRLAEVSRINGKLGGRPKKTQQVIPNNPAGTQQEPSRLQPITKNQEPITRESTSTPAEPAMVEKEPDGLDLESWTRWEKYRRDIKKPIKPASIASAKRKLAGFGGKQSAVVEESIANGWQGLFSTGERNGQAGSSRGSRVADTIAELTGANRSAARTIEGSADRVD